MKKKLLIVLTALSIGLGIGTVAMANSESEVFENFNFRDMLPFMQQMHPDLEEEQLEQMYKSCHGEEGNQPAGGMMQGNQIPDEMRNLMNGQDGERY